MKKLSAPYGFVNQMEADIKIKKGDASAKVMDVHSIDVNLLDAVVRLVRLTDEPGSSNVLAPLIVKEIIYRLLAGGQAVSESVIQGRIGNGCVKLIEPIGQVVEFERKGCLE